MDKIKLKLRNHAMIQLVNCEMSIAQELYDHFSFYVPGYKFMPAYKRKVWDGQIHMLNRSTGEINAGLYFKMKEFAMKRGVGIELEESKFGVPGQKNDLNHMENLKWLSHLNVPFLPRDYQYKAITHALENKRSVLVSPTGSGKSFIIYLLLRWYIDRYKKQTLIIVPTTSLVEQMVSDFASYGYKAENVHKIYSGKDKDSDKKIIVTTWQSIHRLGPGWFSKFGMVIGDECHGFKARSLTTIMNKCINADYRIGTTGTLDGTQVNRLVLEGLFGPVFNVTTTAELQEKKQLASLDIDIILLNYSEESKKLLKGAKYQEEIDFLVSHDKRNKFIRNLACSLDGNTLVLFNLVEKHGKVLRDLIKEKLDNGRRLFYVSGETKTNDREAVRKIVESQSNSITLASLGTFSTGINIRNIHNIIFASPSKSQIRVLQSIGRGLRMSDDGRTTKLYDIADDLRAEKKANFTLRHSAERIKIYNKEKFKHKLTKVDL
jgi:superfamily II DNA or RNA helicase